MSNEEPFGSHLSKVLQLGNKSQQSPFTPGQDKWGKVASLIQIMAFHMCNERIRIYKYLAYSLKAPCKTTAERHKLE